MEMYGECLKAEKEVDVDELIIQILEGNECVSSSSRESYVFLSHLKAMKDRMFVCLLSHIHSKQRILIFNIHLPHKSDQNPENLEDILKFCSAVIEHTKIKNTIVCGDFNCCIEDKDVPNNLFLKPLKDESKHTIDYILVHPEKLITDETIKNPDCKLFDHPYIKAKMKLIEEVHQHRLIS